MPRIVKAGSIPQKYIVPKTQIPSTGQYPTYINEHSEIGYRESDTIEIKPGYRPDDWDKIVESQRKIAEMHGIVFNVSVFEHGWDACLKALEELK